MCTIALGLHTPGTKQKKKWAFVLSTWRLRPSTGVNKAGDEDRSSGPQISSDSLHVGCRSKYRFWFCFIQGCSRMLFVYIHACGFLLERLTGRGPGSLRVRWLVFDTMVGGLPSNARKWFDKFNNIVIINQHLSLSPLHLWTTQSLRFPPPEPACRWSEMGLGPVRLSAHS